jgi:hypothetical protein
VPKHVVTIKITKTHLRLGFYILTNQGLRVLEDRVLKDIFGPKREDLTQE